MIRRDYLLRGIEKLTEFLTTLLNKTAGINSENFETKIQEISNELMVHFGFNLESISEMSADEFIEKIKKIDDTNNELYAIFLVEILKIKSGLKKETTFNAEELKNKTNLLFDYLDENTRTYSLKRMKLKNDLQLLNS